MVNINQASAEELQQLKGIGQVTAEKIVEYRRTKGNFNSVEELANVSGIGQKTLEQLQGELEVGDGSQAAEPTSKVEITFNPQEYGLQEVDEVHLVGEMNDWNPADKSYSLEESGNGVWKNKFDLEPGMEYKIMYDSASWEAEKHIGDFDGTNFKI